VKSCFVLVISFFVKYSLFKEVDFFEECCFFDIGIHG